MSSGEPSICLALTGRMFRTVLPNTTIVADPFHLVKLANTRLDETRRRVQHNILGHRGRGGDPLYRIRKLLTTAKERLIENANAKITRFLEAGDPDNEVAIAWRAKESLEELYTYRAQISPETTSMPSSVTSPITNDPRKVQLRTLKG